MGFFFFYCACTMFSVWHQCSFGLFSFPPDSTLLSLAPGITEKGETWWPQISCSCSSASLVLPLDSAAPHLSLQWAIWRPKSTMYNAKIFFFLQNTNVMVFTNKSLILHLLATSLGPPFSFKCLNSLHYSFNRKTFLREFHHIDIIVLHNCWRLVTSTSMMQISNSTTFKG